MKKSRRKEFVEHELSRRERQIMDCCRHLKDMFWYWQYVPAINDCHTLAWRSLDCAGMQDKWPGAPGGRLGDACETCTPGKTPSSGAGTNNP